MAEDDARASGRGVALMTGAKGLFVLGGLVVQFGVPRLMGSAAEYGLFAAATTLLAIVTNTLTQAAVQATSQDVARHEHDPAGSLRRSLGLALVGGALVAAVFVGAAGMVADQVLHDPSVAPLLRIAGVIVLAYSVYATAIGHLNGLRRFDRQARLDASFTLVRTVGLLAGAALFGAATGTMVGFAAAAVVVACVALLFVGVGRASDSREARGRWLAFFAPIALYQLAVNGLLQLDLEVLKARVAALALAAGAGAVEAAERASTEAGLYRAAQSIAFVPYQLILAVTLVLFPMVARASASGDRDGARDTVRGALRFSTLALVLLLAPTAGGAEGAMRALFDARFLGGAGALGFLALGQIAFALFVVSATALSGDGAPMRVAGAAALGLLVVVVGATLGIGSVGLDGSLGAVVAGSTAAGSLVAVTVTMTMLRARFGAVLPWMTFARAALAGGVGLAVAHVMPQAGRVTGVAALVAGFLAGLSTLALTGEVGRADLVLVRRILGRSKRTPGVGETR